MPLGVNYVRETTIFREYGPLSGDTMSLGFEYAPSGGSLLSRKTFDGDARYYLRLGTNGVLAFRARGYKSWGEFPGYIYFGGNSELRGYDYLAFLGNKGFFTNAELRFPVIEAALTPIGVVGGLRGVFFFNVGGAGYEGQSMTVSTNKAVNGPAAPRIRVRSRRRRAWRVAGLRDLRERSPASASSTAARRTASASRPSRSGSRSTSTGRGGRCSTRTGRTTCSPTRVRPKA